MSPYAGRVRVDPKTLEEEFLMELRDQGLDHCKFTFLRRADGRFYGTIKLEFTTKAEFKQATERGVFVAGEVVSCEDWILGEKTRQCYGCWETQHVRSNCPNKLKCVKCSGNHELKNCDAPKNHFCCPNCSGRHMGWSSKCKYIQQEKAKAAALLRVSEEKSPELPRRSKTADPVVPPRAPP